MATISIKKTILDGNMGDGWKDSYDAACAYAEFLEERIEEEMAELASDGHKIEVYISVARNTCGDGGEAAVVVDNDDYDVSQQALNIVQYTLDTAFEKFLNSPIAENLTA